MSIWAAEWEACMYLHVCLNSLQGSSAPGSPGLSLPCWGWSGPLAMPKAPSMRHPSLRSSPNLSGGVRAAPTMLSHCVGQAMPPLFALQENFPWQAALAVSAQTSLPALLGL